jgi:hypothetical protein
MLRVKSCIRRANAAAIVALAPGSMLSATRKALFLSTMRSSRDIRIDRNPATAPSMNAGAVACEIAVLRWSMPPTTEPMAAHPFVIARPNRLWFAC